MSRLVVVLLYPLHNLQISSPNDGQLPSHWVVVHTDVIPPEVAHQKQEVIWFLRVVFCCQLHTAQRSSLTELLTLFEAIDCWELLA